MIGRHISSYRLTGLMAMVCFGLIWVIAQQLRTFPHSQLYQGDQGVDAMQPLLPYLNALRRHFPIGLVRAYSRRLSTAEAFAEEVRAEGLDAEAVEDPRAALSDADIVVTTTPVLPRTDPFIDAAWLSPGSFAGMVDLGLSWISESLGQLDRVVTDDQAQAGNEGLAYQEPYDGEVADLVVGRLAARQSAEERTALVFAGVGLADVAVAGAVYERAAEAGIGQQLPL